MVRFMLPPTKPRLEGSTIHGEGKEGEACPALLSVPRWIGCTSDVQRPKLGSRLLRRHRLALDKEHPHQPAFTERVVEDLKSEIWNEHQQHD